jgi:hypothetical protein
MTAQEGVNVVVRSAQTGAVFTVFVPRNKFSPENVDMLVRHELDIRDGVAGLGG